MTEADVLNGVVSGLRCTFQVERVILFGSRARNCARPDSDYDILAVVKSDIPYRLRQGVARAAVEEDAPVEMDLLVLTPEELALASTRFDSVARMTIDEGRVIYAA
ncbi:MAG TPA: nucleotidyltransferase domain-containing protein [Chthonomonadales bacterium]|nr:nucleotidyltransferase domain-containing protein [Chthonomonadales bacterium]